MIPLLAAYLVMAAAPQGATVLMTPIVWLVVVIALSKAVKFAMAIAPPIVRTMMPAPPMCFPVLPLRVTSPVLTRILINAFTAMGAVLPAVITLTMMIALRSVEITWSKQASIAKA